MLSTDPKVMNLIALGVAKLNYGSLMSIIRYLGNDLELGLVGFAIVLRTRRDWFEYVDKHGLSDEVIERINAHKGYTTSIYEIAQFTGLGRSTVRRKMQKLKDLNVIDKVADDQWHLMDFRHGEPSRPSLMLREMLQSYVTITHILEQLLPEEISAAKENASKRGVAVQPFALREEDIARKERRLL